MFYYKDKVRVIKGFYTGQTGTVEEVQYRLEGVYYVVIFDLNAKQQPIPSKELELNA